jgi:Caspase domain
MTPNVLRRYAMGAALLVLSSSSPLSASALHAPGGGAVRALVIGVDKYPNWPANAQLAGAVADALDISRALTAAGVKVQTLVDGAAIRSRVISEMNRLVDESKSGDLAIITYSGHGMRVRAYPQWDGLDATRAQSQIVLSRFGKSVETGHDVVVDREMRAWFARFDAKGVDVLVVMDACYGGGMRQVAEFAGGMKVRSLSGDLDDAIHNSFVGIPMSQREARANVRQLPHVTFLAGATESSVVPEMSGIDHANPKAIRGALSYFVARAIEGVASRDGEVTREQLFKFIGPNVRQATDERQFIDFEPRLQSAEALHKIVFRLAGAGSDDPKPDDVEQQPSVPPVDPVRVAIANGPEESFSAIEKGRAPFVRSERPQAELVWNVGDSEALSRGDRVMSKVDGSLLGAVIDRTWAVREIQKLSQSRVIDVGVLPAGKSFAIHDTPELTVGDVRDRYLTVVNIAADGTVQLLFPDSPKLDPHILADLWQYKPVVGEPFGADVVVGVATSRPATELTAWLRTHNKQRDAFDLPGVITRTIATDTDSRVGTVGLYTMP